MFDNKKYIVHEQTYKLNSSVILDTSKAGNNKVNLMLKSGDMVEVSYYVCEVKSFEEILVCDNYQPEYEYQNLKIDDDKIYYFRCEQHVVYINGLGVEKKISKDVWMKELTKNDFENKLDNSEAGIHTDYLTIEGKRYEFSYNVKARLDSSDTEFHYYIEEPYLLGSINGFLIENPIRVVKAKRLQFCDEENGIETIAEYADEEEKYFDPDKNDFTQIELGEDGTFSDIYVILTDGSKITARVYFSDCTIIDTTYEIHSLNYILKDNLPDDNYSLEVIEFSEILMSSWLVNDCSLIYETSRFDIPFYQIKESLNLSSNGTSMELYGHECRIYYNVVESLEVKFGYYQELYSGIKDVYALHMPNLNNQDFVVVKAKNARLGSLDYLNDGTISCDVYDDGEYKYYIFDTSEIEELWLYVDNHDLGGTFEIMDSSRINTIIDESSLIVSGFPYFENGSYTLNFYYTELIQADGTTVSKKTKTLTINYTVDELKEMYAQSGNGDYVNLKVEIGGEIHFVKINASWFSELS